MGLYLTVPDDSIERFIQIVFVFVIYPVTVLLLRKFWKHYYDRRLAKADGEIKPLEKKKEGLLKSVMEKVSQSKYIPTSVLKIIYSRSPTKKHARY